MRNVFFSIGHNCLIIFALSFLTHCNHCNCWHHSVSKHTVLGILSGKRVSSAFLSAFEFVCCPYIYMLTLVKTHLNILWYGVPDSSTKYKNDTADNKTQAPTTCFNCCAACLWLTFTFFNIFSKLVWLEAQTCTCLNKSLLIIYTVYCVYMFVIWFWDGISKVQIWIERVNSKKRVSLCSMLLSVLDFITGVLSVTCTLVKFGKCDRNRLSGSN